MATITFQAAWAGRPAAAARSAPASAISAARCAISRPSAARPAPCLAASRNGSIGGWRRYDGSRPSMARTPFAAEDDEAKTEVEENADGEEGAGEEEGEEEVAEAASEEAPVNPEFAELVAKLKDAGVDESLVNEVEVELTTQVIKASSAADQAASLKDQFLRLTADFDNFRKRTDREKQQLKDRIKGQTLEDLLPVLDNFELAKTQIKTETEGEEKIVNSYTGLYTQMMDVLSKMGLLVVEGAGSEFNPEIHEAIMREESVDFEDGQVAEVFRSGYLIGDQLLRPAMVKVAVSPAGSVEETADAEEE